MNFPPNYLLDRRSEPEARAVLSDWRRENAWPETKLGFALQLAADDAAADDAAASYDDADVADADDAVADVAAYDDADADADDADDDDAVADADDARTLTTMLRGEEMREGLKLIQLAGRYGYSVTRVGWLRRVNGDEWELLNARTVLRTGVPRSLAELAADGPKKDHILDEPGKLPEEIHRLLIRRALVADPKAWGEHCPKPKGWQDE